MILSIPMDLIRQYNATHNACSITVVLARCLIFGEYLRILGWSCQRCQTQRLFDHCCCHEMRNLWGVSQGLDWAFQRWRACANKVMLQTQPVCSHWYCRKMWNLSNYSRVLNHLVNTDEPDQTMQRYTHSVCSITARCEIFRDISGFKIILSTPMDLVRQCKVIHTLRLFNHCCSRRMQNLGDYSRVLNDLVSADGPVQTRQCYICNPPVQSLILSQDTKSLGSILGFLIIVSALTDLCKQGNATDTTRVRSLLFSHDARSWRLF